MLRKLLRLAPLALLFAVTERGSTAPTDLTGRWDLSIGAPDATYPSWLEITRSGNKLSGRFVGKVGSARPIPKIELADNGGFQFSLPPQYEKRKTDLVFNGALTASAAQLRGKTFGEDGNLLPWTGVRAPALPRNPNPRWGKPETLFNGADMTGWRLKDQKLPNGWKVVQGVLENNPPSGDIVTERKFEDFKLHVEFNVAEKSNSGVYLRGRYEVQIEDDYGKPPESHLIGGVYGFVDPTENAGKKAGEWQTYDITLLGRFVTVVLNGKTVIDGREIPGITGGALDSREGEPGPLMLQGDHGKVSFRNIVLTPVEK
jgi:hypothetical protein